MPKLKRSNHDHKPVKRIADTSHGAWIPWCKVPSICRLGFRPASHWRVFLAVLFTSARYGGKDAHVSITDLAELTGLGRRTVQSAVTNLIAAGWLHRGRRYRCLQVNHAQLDASAGSACVHALPTGKCVSE